MQKNLHIPIFCSIFARFLGIELSNYYQVIELWYGGYGY